jgi:UDP-N-acetylglucosamine/UDP-N-acetylgalactosamine diphosphorylase
MPTSPLIEQFRAAGQEQVFAFWDQLSATEQENLLAQANEIDLAEIAHLNQTLLQNASAHAVDVAGLERHLMSRCRKRRRLHGVGSSATGWRRCVATGSCGGFHRGGGQGTRLGYDGPKGTFPVTPVKNKTLFQVFAEKVRAAGERYGKPLHWFIMTSHQNHAATESFFQENHYFGLAPERVHLFRQGRMPAVSTSGKILLESQSSIAMSPDGHGGSLRALDRSGALDLMEREGIDVISYFQVDNPLVRSIDPAFIGWHLRAASEMSSKMIPKAYAEEKVGHFCTQNGHSVVVEYSDLPMELQREVDATTGELRFIAGSIAIHILDRDFVRRMAQSGEGDDSLPFHRADKKIPTVDEQGNPVKPDKPNGVKFEMFVFDALPFAKNPLVIETRRQDDFSPVKNAEGLDSPQTCRDDQLRQFARWTNANGANVSVDEQVCQPRLLKFRRSLATTRPRSLMRGRRANPGRRLATALISNKFVVRGTARVHKLPAASQVIPGGKHHEHSDSSSRPKL